MRDAVRVLDLVRDLTQMNTSQALHWYRSQLLAELDGRTAELLVASGRSDAVLRYLHNLSAGSTG